MHIPHSSVRLTDTPHFLLKQKDLEIEAKIMADLYTDKLFDYYTPLIFEYSRLICDVERFEDENLEVMSKIGMGLCYSKTHELKTLKIYDNKAINESINLYHVHHRKLTNLVDEHLKQYGFCIIIDCHSFSSKPLLYELNQLSPRPDICIGVDSFHTPKSFTNNLYSLLKDYDVKINTPFSGTIVPLKHYHKDKRVISIMLEINKKLYMNEQSFELDFLKFNKLKEDIKQALDSTMSTATH